MRHHTRFYPYLRRLAARRSNAQLIRQAKNLHWTVSDLYADINNMDFDMRFDSWNDAEELENLYSEVVQLGDLARKLHAASKRLEELVGDLANRAFENDR